MDIGYFPGCSLLGSAREYDESLRQVAGALGLELREVPDWNCCGASAAHALDHELALALPARILALAEQAGFSEILVPCSACLARLLSARRELSEDAPLRERIAGRIGLPLAGTAAPVDVLTVLARLLDAAGADRIPRPWSRSVACYYGCLLVRPPELLPAERTEDPQRMDDILSRIGARPVAWSFKTECCGAGLSVARTDLVARLCRPIVEDAVRRGAEAIVVACPMCHSNLDMRRPEIEREAGRDLDIPVLYVTEAVGLAMSLEPKRLGLHRHLVPVVLPESIHHG